MPTNDKRREVAERLRTLASHIEVDKWDVEETLGLYMGECVDGYDPCSVKELADLIEPEPERTCRIISQEHFGDFFNGWWAVKLSCEHEYAGSVIYPCCPYCGSKVVLDDDE